MWVYRLVKARHAASPLEGFGAKTYGGRWNSPGVALVYTADTVSLAALEPLVHLHRGEVLNRYVLVSVDLPDAAVVELDPAALPPDWRRDPPPAATATVGDEWVASGASLALLVPSVLVPQQRNILINPANPDFPAAAGSARAEPFDFDPRFAR